MGVPGGNGTPGGMPIGGNPGGIMNGVNDPICGGGLIIGCCENTGGFRSLGLLLSGCEDTEEVDGRFFWSTFGVAAIDDSFLMGILVGGTDGRGGGAVGAGLDGGTEVDDVAIESRLKSRSKSSLCLNRSLRNESSTAGAFVGYRYCCV
jgi:hypothetical protein